MAGISETKANCCENYVAKAKGIFCSKKSSKELQLLFSHLIFQGDSRAHLMALKLLVQQFNTQDQSCIYI